MSQEQDKTVVPDGLLSTLVEVCGLLTALAGAFMVGLAAGLVATGILLTGAGALLGARTRL